MGDRRAELVWRAAGGNFVGPCALLGALFAARCFLTVRGPHRALLILTVAYLGPEATFTHQAAIRRFGSSLRYASQKTIADVFSEVSKNRLNSDYPCSRHREANKALVLVDVADRSPARCRIVRPGSP